MDIYLINFMFQSQEEKYAKLVEQNKNLTEWREQLIEKNSSLTEENAKLRNKVKCFMK